MDHDKGLNREYLADTGSFDLGHRNRYLGVRAVVDMVEDVASYQERMRAGCTAHHAQQGWCRWD